MQKTVNFSCIQSGFLRILVLSLFSFPITPASAQDIIYLRNGEQIKAKINEVTYDAITYTHFENPTGALLKIYKGEVEKIVYENGDTREFNAASETVEETEPKTDRSGVSQQEIQVKGKRFYIGERRIGTSELSMLLHQSGDPSPGQLFDKSKKIQKEAYIFGYVSGGLGLVSYGVVTSWTVLGFASSTNDQAFATATTALLMTSGGCLAANIALRRKYKQIRLDAIAAYNASL